MPPVIEFVLLGSREDCAAPALRLTMTTSPLHSRPKTAKTWTRSCRTMSFRVTPAADDATAERRVGDLECKPARPNTLIGWRLFRPIRCAACSPLVLSPRILSRVTTLLIAGLPGSGKSQFCRWLGQQHDFAHIETDMDPVINELAANDPRVVLAAATRLKDGAVNVALEWGFRPEFLPQVQAVIGAGFNPWWFGGSEAAARRSYRQRVRGDHAAMHAFETQLRAIQKEWVRIAEVFEGHILPVVDLGPTYLPPEEIYRTIMQP